MTDVTRMGEHAAEARGGLVHGLFAYAASPLALLALAVLGCAALLTITVPVPIGAMYWDMVLYLDAANRIGQGQIPSVDFFAPVGPLGYWLFSGIDALFPRAQPLLLAQWLTFAITAPVMALVLRELDRRSRPLAFALLVPYLVFQISPANVEQYLVFPGVDGYGIYNRHGAIILYALVSALVFLRDARALGFALAWTLLALLLTKVTSFVAGGLIVAYAFAAGRLGLRLSLGVAAAFVLALGALELTTGVVSAYAQDMLTLLRMNSGGVATRFNQAASLHLALLASGTALALTLLILERREIAFSLVVLARRPGLQALFRVLDRAGLQLAVLMFAGLFYETQNTGGQAFIFVIPALLPILMRALERPLASRLTVLGLAAALALPPIEAVAQRAGRSLLAQIGYVRLSNDHLGRLGIVTQHRETMIRAGRFKDLYAEHRATYEAFSAKRILPAHMLYSELDFQTVWLMAIDDGIAAILAHEAERGVRFGTIMTFNFANAFPWAMGREGVKHIPIGMDPFRAVPTPGPVELAAVADADLILRPLCPVTVANDEIQRFYAPAMTGRREIALGRCWTGYVKGALAQAGLRR